MGRSEGMIAQVQLFIFVQRIVFQVVDYYS